MLPNRGPQIVKIHPVVKWHLADEGAPPASPVGPVVSGQTFPIMTIQAAVDILRQTVWTSFVLVSPILSAAIAIGLAVSILQTVTSIQEQTLAFVPKLIGVGVVVVGISGWMLKTLVEFTLQIFQQMASLG
jgi:flagellar biosynthetic protein FliQ